MRRGYVVPMRWMVIYGYGVPGGVLNLNSTNYPDHGHHGDPPLSRKNSHGRAGNRTRDLMISSQKHWPLDHDAGTDLFNLRFSVRSGWWVLQHFTTELYCCTLAWKPWNHFTSLWPKVHIYVLSCDLSARSLRTSVISRDSSDLQYVTTLVGQWSQRYLCLNTFGTRCTMTLHVILEYLNWNPLYNDTARHPRVPKLEPAVQWHCTSS
jgi:hypothetical protein